MKLITETNKDNFFNSEEASLINDLLIDAVGRSSLGVVLKTLGYSFEEVEKAKNTFKSIYTGSY